MSYWKQRPLSEHVVYREIGLRGWNIRRLAKESLYSHEYIYQAMKSPKPRVTAAVSRVLGLSVEELTDTERVPALAAGE